MKKKLFGILICMLMTTALVIPVTGSVESQRQITIKKYNGIMSDYLLQPPKQWDQTYGGTNNDGARDVQQTADGGYIMAGWTDSSGAGGLDAWLIKTDAAGNQIWAQTYGGAQDDWANSVYITNDGGYIISGGTKSYGPGTPTYINFWVIKTDNSGIKQWDKVFGGIWDDEAWAVEQTTDGGYAIYGSQTWHYGAGLTDFWLVKTDVNGNEQWNNTFGGTDDDFATSGHQTSDGGYIVSAGCCTLTYGPGGEGRAALLSDLQAYLENPEKAVSDYNKRFLHAEPIPPDRFAQIVNQQHEARAVAYGAPVVTDENPLQPTQE